MNAPRYYGKAWSAAIQQCFEREFWESNWFWPWKKMHRYQNVARFLCHTLRNWRAAQSAPLINYSYLDYLRIYYFKYTIYTVLEDLIWTWKRITLENPSRCTMLCAHFSCFLSLSLSLPRFLVHVFNHCMPPLRSLEDLGEGEMQALGLKELPVRGGACVAMWCVVLIQNALELQDGVEGFHSW